MAARTTDWSTVPELVSRLERQWKRGKWLKPYALGEPFEPVSISVQKPTAIDLVERTAEVQSWVAEFRSDVAKRPQLRVTDKVVRNRSVGANAVPASISIDSLEGLIDVVGARSEVEAFDGAASSTETIVPEATHWVRRHPRQVVEGSQVWPQLISAVRWVLDHDVSQLDLRHIDAPGVDSKFLVENRRLVRPLLDAVLAPERVDTEHNDLDRRYGFRPRPTYVRLRTLGNDIGLLRTLSETEVRVDELAMMPLPVATVYVVENRASFNAFPHTADSIVVFGGGYAVSTLRGLGWLRNRRLIYWGDIDTHGFRILSRLRALFPHCESMLMDSATLEANLARTVGEPAPLTEHLDHLTPDEMRLYGDLREDRYGAAVRLEQERISFGRLQSALDATGLGVTVPESPPPSS